MKKILYTFVLVCLVWLPIFIYNAVVHTHFYQLYAADSRIVDSEGYYTTTIDGIIYEAGYGDSILMGFLACFYTIYVVSLGLSYTHDIWPNIYKKLLNHE